MTQNPRFARIERPTALGAALFKAAAQVAPEVRAGTISNQIMWRGLNTGAGVVSEPAITLPKRAPMNPLPAPVVHPDGSDKAAAIAKEAK